VDLSDFIEEWRDVPASTISDHGAGCCSRARSWFESMDLSQGADPLGAAPPVWLGKRFAWGAHAWPIHWCEAARSDRLDCGALAGIAWHLMRKRGADAVHVQLIERFNAQNVNCWAALWESAGLPCEWAAGQLVYHEAAGGVEGGRLRVWDPTDGRWLEPDELGVYGAAVAIRVTSPYALEPSVFWGEHAIATGGWIPLEETLSERTQNGCASLTESTSTQEVTERVR
jgi:hypothetical protein